VPARRAADCTAAERRPPRPPAPRPPGIGPLRQAAPRTLRQRPPRSLEPGRRPPGDTGRRPAERRLDRTLNAPSHCAGHRGRRSPEASMLASDRLERRPPRRPRAPAGSASPLPRTTRPTSRRDRTAGPRSPPADRPLGADVNDEGDDGYPLRAKCRACCSVANHSVCRLTSPSGSGVSCSPTHSPVVGSMYGFAVILPSSRRWSLPAGTWGPRRRHSHPVRTGQRQDAPTPRPPPRHRSHPTSRTTSPQRPALAVHPSLTKSFVLNKCFSACPDEPQSDPTRRRPLSG
jgi:hypothetical protein